MIDKFMTPPPPHPKHGGEPVDAIDSEPVVHCASEEAYAQETARVLADIDTYLAAYAKIEAAKEAEKG